MSITYARIIVTHHELPLNRRYETYEWDGDSRWPVIVDFYLLDDVQRGKLPWPVVEVPEMRHDLWFTYYRTDRLLIVNAWLARVVARLHRLGRGLKARVLLTCHIWGVGDTGEAQEFRWSNLRLPNKYRRW